MFILNRHSLPAGRPHLTPRPATFAGRCALACLLGVLLVRPVRADELVETTQLLRSGNVTGAIARANAYLATHPKDGPMRFLKGIVLAEQGKVDDAIDVFAKLSDDHRNAPEPYNNLAVLYAANGQYDKARDALDKAMRTNPAYGTAFDNLGDLHAKMASQAYDKALGLDATASNAKATLRLVRTFGSGKLNVPVMLLVPTAAALKPVPTQVATLDKRTLPTARPVAPAPASAKVSASVLSAVAGAASSLTKSASVSVTSGATVVAPTKLLTDQARLQSEALDMLTAWAKAWSARDVKAYLNFYGNDFKPGNGMSRKDWSIERRARIVGKGRISVTISEAKVVLNGAGATISFHQRYASDRLSVQSRKTIVLQRVGSTWRIVQERAGN